MIKTYFRKGRIFGIFLLIFVMCSFHSIGHIFGSQQSSTDFKEPIIQFYQQRNNDAYETEDELDFFREITFPSYRDLGLNAKNTDVDLYEDVNFFGQSNNSCFIVKVTSSSEIYIDRFEFDIKLSVDDKRTSSANLVGAFITNKSWLTTGYAGCSEANMIGNLRYVHLEFGKINYTYEHRMTYNITEQICRLRYTEPQKPILSPGTWYFIFFGCLYDLPQEDTIVSTSVWLDFTGDTSDLQVSSYEDGKINGVWYGEFDANIIISKASTFEMLINGRVKFPVNNTFIYTAVSWPIGTGFWKVRLITPEDVYKLNMLILRNYHFPDIDFHHKCMRGIEDRSGEYELQVDYIDFAPLVCINAFADTDPTYFIGLDVDLR